MSRTLKTVASSSLNLMSFTARASITGWRMTVLGTLISEQSLMASKLCGLGADTRLAHQGAGWSSGTVSIAPSSFSRCSSFAAFRARL